MAHRTKLPERYPKIIAMYARGFANSLEVLDADFGHWPPNNLDIVHPPNIDIKLKSIFSTATGLSRFIPTTSNLILMGSLFKSHPISMLVYLGLSTALRVAALGGFVNPSKSSTTMFINDMYRLFTITQGGRRFLSHVITHEFKHIIQARDKEESLSSALENNRLSIKQCLKDKPRARIKYLSHEAELQARMHTTMVGIYHQFERLPLNRNELYAALASQGLKVPEALMAEVQRAEEGRSVFEIFQKDNFFFKRYADKGALKNIAHVLEALKPEQELRFWTKIVPFIYGDLLELYGDRYGHKRMGHSHNIQLREVFYRSAEEYRVHSNELSQNIIITDEEVQTVKKYVDLALSIVTKMDKEDSVNLGCMIARGDVYHEYGRACAVSAKTNPIGKAAFEKIWSRNDLTGYDRQLLHDAITEAARGDVETKRKTGPWDRPSGSRPSVYEMSA